MCLPTITSCGEHICMPYRGGYQYSALSSCGCLAKRYDGVNLRVHSVNTALLPCLGRDSSPAILGSPYIAAGRYVQKLVIRVQELTSILIGLNETPGSWVMSW